MNVCQVQAPEHAPFGSWALPGRDAFSTMIISGWRGLQHGKDPGLSWGSLDSMLSWITDLLHDFELVSLSGPQFLHLSKGKPNKISAFQMPSGSIRSDQISRLVVSNSLRSHESQHARPPCPSPTHRVHSDSRPLSQWCHPAISSSVIPFSSCSYSLPGSQSFPMSQLFAAGGQSTGVSALASVLLRKSQGWSPSEWTSWISKGLSRVFSNTTVQKHQFFRAQPSSQSNSHIHTWPQEKPSLD